ncbi:hypothetical protein M422DRAFT_178100 [Sphaerobolus stellatus SS14]|uniref:EIF3m n=1 Tax=Sphaerobolus stellatus (strain SS14) TaxID=990650 RepID=A0A0C9U3M8_SPHS4|nr:hypothetical protein M422DRAFT_178100 [Sphaerobolus stellatus SS14]
MADSLSIFGEGSFEEQIQELVKYLARGEVDESRATFIRPFQEALTPVEGQTPISEDEEKKKAVIKLLVKDITGLGDGSDREIEGFFNLVYAHVLALYPPDSADSTELVTSLISAITSSPPTDHTFIKYRVLTNLFNALPNRSTLRPRVYKALLNLATENEELDSLQIKPTDVEKWIDEWDISAEEKSNFVKSISDAFAKLGQKETAYTYEVAYVRSISPSSPKAQPAALFAIATALRLPSIFNFDALFKIDAVQVAKDQPLYALLRVILEGSIADLDSWVVANEATLNEFGLEKKALGRKLRLLVLADFLSKRVGQEVPYADLASALQVDQSQVEVWVIDGSCLHTILIPVQF